MSDVLTFNTETDVVKTERVDPLPVYTDDHFMLSQKMPVITDPVPNPVLNNLIQRMKVTMKLHSGLGLSANQCGVQQRVFVMLFNNEIVACINPEVVEMSEEIVRSREGCLTFPGMFLTIPRNEWIMAEFTNEHGTRVRARLDGLSARCFLHELDHMNGVKFTDHVGPVAIQLAKQKQAKLIKQIQRKNRK